MGSQSFPPLTGDKPRDEKHYKSRKLNSIPGLEQMKWESRNFLRPKTKDEGRWSTMKKISP